MLAVIHRSHGRTLACSCEISLKSWGASVEERQDISIVGPCISECLLEFFIREDFERLAARLTLEAKFVELDVSNLPCEDRLYNVGTIKAVHAIGSHDTALSAKNAA